MSDKTGLPILCLNTIKGKEEKGEFGLCALPHKKKEAREAINQAFDYADKIGINYHSCVNTPTQFAALAATTGEQDCVDNMKEAFKRRAELITGNLNNITGISCQMPGGAFYAFPNISQLGVSSELIQNQLLEEFGVAVLAGTAFGSYGEGHLRFSSANSDTQINEACNKLKQLTLNYV